MKNLKTMLALLLVLTLTAALFVGCSAEPKSKETETASQAETQPAGSETQSVETEEMQPADLSEVFVTFNDVKVVLGAPYADCKDQLGAEIKPADVEGSCDPGSDWCRTYHYYDGLTVQEDQNGNVAGFEFHEPVDTVAFMGQLKLGDPIEKVPTVLGETEPSEYGIFYMTDAVYIALYPDEDNGTTIADIMVMAN